MSHVAGASKALRKNIKRIRKLISDDLGSTPSPRSDYDDHFKALIREAYRRGFEKAHQILFDLEETQGVPTEIAFEGKLPAFKGRKKFSFCSKIVKI
jgi:hypothetical protein